MASPAFKATAPGVKATAPAFKATALAFKATALAFKGTDADMQCRGVQYQLGTTEHYTL